MERDDVESEFWPLPSLLCPGVDFCKEMPQKRAASTLDMSSENRTKWTCLYSNFSQLDFISSKSLMFHKYGMLYIGIYFHKASNIPQRLCSLGNGMQSRFPSSLSGMFGLLWWLC